MNRHIHAMAGAVLAGICAICALGLSTPAQATPITQTIDLGQVFTGSQPTGSMPWLTAIFEGDTGTNTGTLRLTSNLQSTDFVQGMKNAKSNVGWGFYLNQSLDSLDCKSGTCADHSFFGGSYHAGPVSGTYNLAFGWTSHNRFQSGSSAVYTLTFADALTGDPFGGDPSGWLSVAHVQGINGASCSGWIVAGAGSDAQGVTEPCGSTPAAVPEPGNLAMLGLGLALIGVFVGVRRRRDEQ